MNDQSGNNEFNENNEAEIKKQERILNDDINEMELLETMDKSLHFKTKTTVMENFKRDI